MKNLLPLFKNEIILLYYTKKYICVIDCCNKLNFTHINYQLLFSFLIKYQNNIT